MRMRQPSLVGLYVVVFFSDQLRGYQLKYSSKEEGRSLASRREGAYETLRIVESTSLLSTCLREQIGCLLIRRAKFDNLCATQLRRAFKRTRQETE